MNYARAVRGVKEHSVATYIGVELSVFSCGSWIEDVLDMKLYPTAMVDCFSGDISWTRSTCTIAKGEGSFGTFAQNIAMPVSVAMKGFVEKLMGI